jgi:hypothetical protein
MIITPVFQTKPTTTLSATAAINQGDKTPIQSQRYCKILPKPLNLLKSQYLSHAYCLSRSLAGYNGVISDATKKDAETQTLRRKTSKTSFKTSSTQTMFDISTCINSDMISAANDINYSSVGTQVNKTVLNSVSTMMDFGSQVMVPDICGSIAQSSSIGTQHDNHLFMNHSSLDVPEDTACFSLSSQTMLTGNDLQIADPRFLSSSETQTQDFDQVSLEDNAAQTLISILDFDPSCSTDCGTQTQTQRMIDEILSQSSDVELTESQTQTWLSSLMPLESEMTNPNHDLNSRTTLEDLVNIETQTPVMMNDLPFDVGLINTETQTIPEPFANNSWAFEPINTQTQMTQTAADGDMYSQLMDTYTQTFLGDIHDVSVLSSVQTQT